MAITMEEFEKQLLSSALKLKKGKEAKKFLRKEGTKLKNRTKKKARAKVKKRSGEYVKSIKRGKAWTDKDESGIRSYSGLKYANTIETGRVETSKSKGGYIKGSHIFRDSSKEFAPEFDEDIVDWIDNLLDDEGLS